MASQTTLSLRPISRLGSGEPVPPLTLEPPNSFIVGRSSEADWPIAEPWVSRRHASLTWQRDRWLITDLGSRHGTTVNGRELEPNAPVAIEHGDEIGFGSWRCRCSAGAHRPGMTTPFIDTPMTQQSISAVDTSRMTGIAQRGLEALLSLSEALDAAPEATDVAEAVVAAVREATGCRRVVVARPASEDEVEVLATTTDEVPQLSRSLIDAAARDGLVELRVTGTQGAYADSIMDLKIRSAICAPMHAGGAPAAFVVLDTRDTESAIPSDAAAFCQSVARIAGLALERIRAASLAERHQQLRRDLEAARRAQELLSPARNGGHGKVAYHFESIPGRFVAGDLFDFFPVGPTRAAFFLGDVSGKGVGAAMLMASAQSQLRTQLLSGRDLVAAAYEVNRDLCARTDPSRFVTLIAGLVDVEHASLEIIDAGHGFGVLVPPDGEPIRIDAPGGLPLGVVAEGGYESRTFPFEVGTRFVAFSDGAVEQPGPEGDQFGLERVLASIAASGSPESIVAGLHQAVRSHAQADLADDLTVAALTLLDVN